MLRPRRTALISVLSVVVFSACHPALPGVADLPNVAVLDAWMAAPNVVYARDGQVIGRLPLVRADGGPSDREVVALNDVSMDLRGAVVTSEDRRFYQHHGFDLRGMGRALVHGVGGKVEGGSTLTQQLVKNTLLADLHGARTTERKLKEILLARKVEAQYSKDQILGAYLNVVYWGSGGARDILGVQAAARAYFSTNASDLTLAESVYLATLLPSPGRYFDYVAYRPLMRVVLNHMAEDGRVTQAQANAAWQVPLEPNGWRVRYGAAGEVISATLDDREAKNRAAMPAPLAHPYFIQAVQRELSASLSSATLARGGLRIFTTLDLQAQVAAEGAARRAQLPDGASLGLVLVQPQTGEVLALQGGSLADGQVAGWDNATQARRQLGSSIKPLLYTLALQQGFRQFDSVLDAPLDGAYQPQNYDGHFSGQPVTLRFALDHSLNLPSVRLAEQVGLEPFRTKLRDLGLTPARNAGLSLAIGALEASPLQLACAYAPFANGGVWHSPVFVTRVADPTGQPLLLPAPVARRIWDEQTAYLGLDLIRGVVNDLGPEAGGLAWRARISGWPVGGKTGTTNDVKDLWFAGVTPTIVGAVWVGRKDSRALPKDSYSGEIPTPIWREAVEGALAGRPRQTFTPPPGVQTAWVDGAPMAMRSTDPPPPTPQVTVPASGGGTGAPPPTSGNAPPEPSGAAPPAADWNLPVPDPQTTPPGGWDGSGAPSMTDPVTPLAVPPNSGG